MKKCLSLLFALLLLLCLPSCESVRDDIPVQRLADAVGTKIEGFSHLSQASADYIRYCMKSDLSLYDEYLILYPFSGTAYNEIGIFKLAADADGEKALSEIEGYLNFKKKNWDTRYNADEYGKIERARIVRHGRYFLYTILSQAERDAAEKAFADALKR